MEAITCLFPWDEPIEESPAQRSEEGEAKPRLVLRPYQTAAVDSCFRDLEECRSAMIVMATGLGKTAVLSEVINRWSDGRVLVLVHLEELLQKVRQEIEAMTGEMVGVDRAGEKPFGERVVVGTIQTVGRRLKRLPTSAYSLVIIDECHHASGQSYLNLIEWFGDAKVVGLTATDYRRDGKALPFDRCSFRMGIKEALDEGFLVPVEGKTVQIESVDLRRVKTAADGEDLDQAELDEEMVKGASAIADVIKKEHYSDKGILFFPGRASASLTAELLNARGIPTVYIDGTIKGGDRDVLMKRLRGGEARWLCNVGIATEGFNWPDAQVVGMCMPTLSRSAYVQRVGRGTRPLQGILNGIESAEARKAAIAASAKPHMTIVDFTGVSSSHSLITHASFLEEHGPQDKDPGEFEPDVASGYADGDQGDGAEKQAAEIRAAQEALRERARREAANAGIARGVQSKTLHHAVAFDPFAEGDGKAESEPVVRVKHQPTDAISDKQYALLSRYGISGHGSLNRKQGQSLIGFIAKKGWALSAKDKNVLQGLFDEMRAQ